MSIKKILSLFLVGVVQPKLNLYLRGNQTINMEDSYLGMLHDDRSHSTTITVPKSTLTFQLHLQDQALLNLYIRMSTRVSQVQVQVQVVIKLKAAKLLVLISM